MTPSPERFTSPMISRACSSAPKIFTRFARVICVFKAAAKAVAELVQEIYTTPLIYTSNLYYTIKVPQIISCIYTYEAVKHYHPLSPPPNIQTLRGCTQDRAIPETLPRLPYFARILDKYHTTCSGLRPEGAKLSDRLSPSRPKHPG